MIFKGYSIPTYDEIIAKGTEMMMLSVTDDLVKLLNSKVVLDMYEIRKIIHLVDAFDLDSRARISDAFMKVVERKDYADIASQITNECSRNFKQWKPWENQ